MKLPTGLYDSLITKGIAQDLPDSESRDFETRRGHLDPGDSHIAFVRHLRTVLQRALKTLPDEGKIDRQADLCNRLIELIDAEMATGARSGELADRIASPVEALLALVPRTASMPGVSSIPERPAIPLSTSDLLINARGEPSLGNVLAREFASADRVDLLCAFVRWNGLRILEEPIRRLRERGCPLRVLTTTYTGSTERRALELLVQHGAEVKVSYDTQTTRLHAKAWLFHRNTGFSTAYIGSSNLSHSAMIEGREWNVRLSQSDASDILGKFQANFDSYWADPGFETFEPTRDRDRFDAAVRPRGDSTEIPFLSLDLTPYPHQVEILEKLQVERQRHGRHRNLVVAATGTGKTLVAAFDYKRLKAAGARGRLLYVAHRKEILKQSLGAFRHVLRDGAFGELYVDGERPERGEHVFASIQSLSQIALDQMPPDAFDIVVVDEFHHAAASTYRRLLDHIQPKELVGLTATPERADGQSILDRFDGRIAAEIRLWEALERSLLCPFQYFGIHDQTDLSHVRWSRRGYDTSELQNLYTGNDVRVRLVVEELRKKVRDVSSMRAIGFCVSIAHAEFMAAKFNQYGIPSVAVSAESSPEEREQALRRLRDRQINTVFAVDLFNEGVDIPEIDTVLFLRPTESATVFLQQLGRGLRQMEGKDCLTVLDFIGQASNQFRFDQRYRALTGASRSAIKKQVEEGFPLLPAGCSIQLDRVAADIVLSNINEALGSSFKGLAAELRSLGRDVDLAEFLREADLSLEDLYRNPAWYWSKLRREVGLITRPEGPDESVLTRGFRRLLDLEDPEWIDLLRTVLGGESPPDVAPLHERQRRILTACHFELWGASGSAASLQESLTKLWRNDAVRFELVEFLGLLEASASHLPVPLDHAASWQHSIPLALHCRYSLDDILAAFARSTVDNPYRIREGIYFDEPTNSYCFFVTLEKTMERYSPTTLYRDYAISPDLFHWESQSTTSQISPTGHRLIHHAEQKVSILLFVRERASVAGRTLPYMFLGPAEHISHEGDRPIAITWKLGYPMPADFFRDAKVAAG
jgi:superfamily II DNA or RNA helicase/HKD family nuclease